MIERRAGVGAREQRKALAVSLGARDVAQLRGVVEQFATRGVGQRCQRRASAILATPQLIGASEVVERAATITQRQPPEAQRAMRIVMAGVEAGCAREGRDRIVRAPEVLQGDAAIVVRAGVVLVGGKGCVEVRERCRVVPSRGSDDGEVVQDRRPSWRQGESGGVGGLGFNEPSGGVVRVGIGEQGVEGGHAETAASGRP